MTEQELLEKIKSSAEEIEIPEGLSPDSIKMKLDWVKQAGETDTLVDEKRHWYRGRKMLVAAAAVLVCGTGAFAAYQMTNKGYDDTDNGNVGTVVTADAGADTDETAAVTEGAAGNEGLEEDVGGIAKYGKKDAGELYVVAENYGEIYDILEENARFDMDMGAAADAATTGSIGVEDYSGTRMEDFISYSDSATAESTMNSGSSPTQQKLEQSAEEAYSGTNLQTEGVDESDIIKTDGSYIYIVSGDAVKIIDIQGNKMKETGEISISMNSAADRVMEMYVDGDKLNLIVQREETELSQGAGEIEDSIAEYDVYYMNSKTVTELQTYDISSRKKPVLKGSITQDGTYNTSRKIGQIVYLFTEKYLQMPNLTRAQAVMEDNAGDWIPLVNGTAIASDCIYIPKQGSQGLIISSVNVDKPDKVVDNTLIMNDYVNIYVSTEALYLYGQDYTGSNIMTQIAKFGLKEGVIDAVAATSAAGEVYDTFAINEYQGKLRLLTTDWSRGENENSLYLFDENLQMTGSLTGIAKGEQIYAARYFGDTAYFVTYRNTDPLFAVDLSDERNPKILSELKITGFSEYLHFWGRDKLVGIGYETDPDTGRQEGIKLTMFDISNPSDLRTAGTCVIENIDYSPALYEYKCVLADAEENMIGFAAESYGRDWECSYLLFSWEDGKFKELMSESIRQDTGTNLYRGLYVGDTFYLVSPDSIISYDREDGYQKLENLEL